VVFRVVTPCNVPEDGGSMVLRNFSILPHHYTALLDPEDGSKKFSEMLVSNYITTRHYFTLKMEVAKSSEMLAFYRIITRHYFTLKIKAT
jgi:hypothetical protein